MTPFETAYGSYRRSVWFSRFFCLGALAFAIAAGSLEYHLGNYPMLAFHAFFAGLQFTFVLINWFWFKL